MFAFLTNWNLCSSMEIIIIISKGRTQSQHSVFTTRWTTKAHAESSCLSYKTMATSVWFGHIQWLNMKSWFRWFALLPPHSKAGQVKGKFHLLFMVFCTLTKSSFLLSCFQTPNEATLKVINMWAGLGWLPDWQGFGPRSTLTGRRIPPANHCHPRPRLWQITVIMSPLVSNTH